MLQSPLGQQPAPIGQGYQGQLLSSCHMPGVASWPLQSSHHFRHQKVMKGHLQGCTLSGRQLTCVTVREKSRKFKIPQGTKLIPVTVCLNKLTYGILCTSSTQECTGLVEHIYISLQRLTVSHRKEMLNTNLTNIVMHTEKIPK